MATVEINKVDVNGVQVADAYLSLSGKNADGSKIIFTSDQIKVGKGGKTIIPCHASVKMDVRLVQGMKAMETFECIRKFVEKTEPLVKIELKDMMEPSTTDPALPIMRCVEKAVAAGYGKEPVSTPVLGGSLPNYVFTDILGMPVVSVPYANPDENNHAPNENIKLWCYYAGIRTTAQFLYEVSNMED